MDKTQVDKVIDISKKGVLAVVSVGVGAITANNLNDKMPESQPLYMKLAVGLGALVIGNIVVDKTTEYMDTKIDDTVKLVEETLENMELEDETGTEIVVVIEDEEES